MKQIVVDVRKINDSGIGTYIKNCVIPIVNKLTDNYNVFLIVNKNFVKNYYIDNKIKLIIFRSKNFSILEQFEYFFKIKKFDFFWGTSISVPLLLNIKLINTIYDISYLSLKSNSPYNIFRKLITLFYFYIIVKKSVLLIFISEFSQKEFLTIFKRKLTINIRKTVIPLGVNEQWLNNSYKSFNERKYLIMVGNLRPHKNMQFVINSINSLYNIKNFQLIIVGNISEQNLIDNNVIDSIKHNKWIDYKGELKNNELMKLVKNSSGLIAPSKYEGFGLTVLEGMASKVPVLASDIPSHREVGGETIFYFNPLCSNDFKSKLDIILNHKNLRHLVDKAYIRAQNLTWDHTVGKTLQEIKKIL